MRQITHMLKEQFQTMDLSKTGSDAWQYTAQQLEYTAQQMRMKMKIAAAASSSSKAKAKAKKPHPKSNLMRVGETLLEAKSPFGGRWVSASDDDNSETVDSHSAGRGRQATSSRDSGSGSSSSRDRGNIPRSSSCDPILMSATSSVGSLFSNDEDEESDEDQDYSRVGNPVAL